MAQSASRAAARPRPAKDRSNLYEEITSNIIAELEAGRLPWVQPWGSSGVRAPLGMPKNAATGRAYSGINVLILWAAVVAQGFSVQCWLTFKRWHWVATCARASTGRWSSMPTASSPMTCATVPSRGARNQGQSRFSSSSRVQCRAVRGLPEGIAALPPQVDTSHILPQVEELIRAPGADVRIGGDKAYYDVAGDFIRGRRAQAEEEGGRALRDGLKEAGREAPAGPSRRTDMAKSQPNITLSVSRDIPFNKLVLSQANVRRIKASVAIEEFGRGHRPAHAAAEPHGPPNPR